MARAAARCSTCLTRFAVRRGPAQISRPGPRRHGVPAGHISRDTREELATGLLQLLFRNWLPKNGELKPIGSRGEIHRRGIHTTERFEVGKQVLLEFKAGNSPAIHRWATTNEAF